MKIWGQQRTIDGSADSSLDRHGQRGVALISILLLLTLLATLAIYAAEDQDMAIRRASIVDLAEQGYQVNISGEQWVVKVLEKDQQDDAVRRLQDESAIDHASESWGNLGPPVEVGDTGTTLLMVIEDLQGKLNLNNLVQGKTLPVQEDPAQVVNETDEPSGNEEERPNALWFQIFENLFNSLSLNPELVNSLIDWVDPDSDPIGTTGAEDFYYTGLEVPYRTANRNMASTAELIQIKEMSSEVIAQLLLFVTALPTENITDLKTVNVNTASAMIISLFADDQSVDIASFEPLTTRREIEPFSNLEEFASEFTDLGIGGLVPGWQDMLSVSSEFYAGRSCAEAGRVKFSMSSLLRKDNEKENVKVLQRERYFGCPAFANPEGSSGESSDDTST